MKKNNYLKFFIIGSIIFFSNCENSKKTEATTFNKQDDLIEITKEQFIADSMILGKPDTQVFHDKVACSGYILAPVNGVARISAKMPGQVENINYLPGEFVKKGQTLCSISSQDLIVLQQHYQESIVELNKLQDDFKRAETLYKENIGSKKDFIAIESKFNTTVINSKSLKLQLQQLNLDVSKIEKGKLYTSFPVKAPIDGYIVQQNIVLGQYIETQNQIIEMINTNSFHLELALFEKDIHKLQKGQKVFFTLMEDKKTSYTAVLSHIGKSINSESMSIKCIAQIEDKDHFNWIHKSFVEATIYVGETKAMAIPNDALTKVNGDYYLLQLDHVENDTYFFKRIKALTGKSSDYYTEVFNDLEDKDICIKGAYNAYSE